MKISHALREHPHALVVFLRATSSQPRPPIALCICRDVAQVVDSYFTRVHPAFRYLML